MATWISILRGINVSGKRSVKMETLRKSYESLGFQNVVTYVQSGNVIFSTVNATADTLTEAITDQIEKDFGFHVTVIVMSSEKLKHIVDNNPFAKDNEKENAFLHVTFLASKPKDVDLEGITEKARLGEEISVTEDAVYLYCPGGYGRTRLNNNFLEKRLQVRATTRNWKTTNRLLEMTDQVSE